ncbi:hypothetical protein K491DRAFT_688019 [Lophiostoma macrostomum CBS 122681]|uniref:Gfd2/YDR514C-like C-terminal domain-containing protein n=1 Tax=Lophiostoma macrostomum CBS 122681 TaxID=1314788 RepID=A0A6A6TPM1_9PLEO|nr:hypothetical protein K491DRAFT_688019 [Lophiostoma macrostomum CBS 122681]
MQGPFGLSPTLGGPRWSLGSRAHRLGNRAHVGHFAPTPLRRCVQSSLHRCLPRTFRRLLLLAAAPLHYEQVNSPTLVHLHRQLQRPALFHKTSAMAGRFARLQTLVENDLKALPDRPPTPDEDTGGGILLDDEVPQNPTATEQVQHAPAEPETSSPSAAVESPQQEATEKRFVWLKGAASSYNLGSAPKLSPLPAVKLAPTRLTKGDLTSPEEAFTPIQALAKYPYKFCNQSNSQEIASAFFDGGKFWAREWDLYYVWDIDGTANKPIMLVLESQVEQLLKEINRTLNLQIKITNQQREDGLVGRFPDHPRCLPRYLGRSHCREDYDDMASHAPSEPVITAPEGRTLEDFKRQMEDMWDIQKNKNKAKQEKKRLDRIEKQKVLTQQFKRAQRYLGLRPTAQGVAATTVDPALPAPFPFDRSVVFVCVDVESYEKAHNKITEVGIASLDTRDLIGPPGTDGENWRSKIQARHFRIKEYQHLVNYEFVHGCPDKFEFGTSMVVPLEEAPDCVAACFMPPFCGQIDHMLDKNEKRNLILLGHDTMSDVQYLRTLGFDPLDRLRLPNMLEVQDSAALYRVWRREPQITKLGNILYDFDITGWNLHNAGNDAVYTVQAMLGVCVREATIRASAALESTRQEQQEAKVAKYTEDAKGKATEEAEGWSETEDNGGAPELPVVKEKLKPTPAVNSSGGGHIAELSYRPKPNRGEFRGAQPMYRSRPDGRPQARGAFSSQNSQSARGEYRGRGRGRGGGSSHSQGSDFDSSGRGRGRGRGRGNAHGQPSGGHWADREYYPEHPRISHKLIDLS